MECLSLRYSPLLALGLISVVASRPRRDRLATPEGNSFGSRRWSEPRTPAPIPGPDRAQTWGMWATEPKSE